MRIGTLNTIIKYQFSEKSKNVRLTCEKLCLLENFRILQLFFTFAPNFQDDWKIIRYLCSVSQCASFEPSQGYIQKEHFLKFYYRGSQALKPEFSKDYKS